MGLNNKVVWSEGMFIRPQHFQQQARHSQHLVTENNRLLVNYAYGLTELKIDNDLLATGRLSVLSCRGIFPDGTCFNVAEDNSFVEILDVPENIHDTMVYLALPLQHPNITEITLDEKKVGLSRFVAAEDSVADNTSATNDRAGINLAKMHLRLLLDSDDLSQFTCLPIARIAEVGEGKKAVLDPDFLPICLNCKSFTKLKGYLVELHTLLRHRRQILSERLGEISRTTSLSAVSDLLLLQIASRYEVIFAHMLKLPLLHPEDFYVALLQLAGELNVFVKKQQLDMPEYNHDDLQNTIDPVLVQIRSGLSHILKHAAELMPLEKQTGNISVATIYSRDILDDCRFIVKIKADMDTEELIKRFPSQVKVGPVEEIKQLVKSQLPGLKLKLLPVVPAQLPYQSGCSYFELEAKGELWTKLKKSAGFAFHIGGDFPNLQLELWAIRGA